MDFFYTYWERCLCCFRWINENSSITDAAATSLHLKSLSINDEEGEWGQRAVRSKY